MPSTSARFAGAWRHAAGFGVFSAARGTDFMLVRHLRDGGLDAGFGTRGKASTGFDNGSRSDEAQAVAVQPDGKILVAGSSDQGTSGYDFALARYHPDGTLDAGFGRGGRVVVPVSASNCDEATGLVQQADDRLLLGGWTYTGNSSSADTVLLRLNADGSRDTAFGPGGVRVTPVAAGTRTDAGRALALQPDERLPAVRALQAGEAAGRSDLDIVLMRHWL